ncbi:HAD superfamily hydrolase (TIGR01509 family) [Halanaerobium saccharolyticum]|uniref:HAD superfamily hydrolase (TIGR01509 family) n=1 Tax=Halanaerobium saccharolyticum TaxID=43595 RepID=A0A4R7YRU8_9FIRM|nr:HAD hydrolase-like protein [Halanaerobium saccharolyticum]RAK10255.1 HAD superfamily hydrolase (TIGR01509 family) [Halanaerobium saccharolyticum]TDW00467.1 HAD superfamily hydrolase (TIGR01509 family) [Halanaerobium saccharolyticum]TDX52052.1 HAD superfamily hydrolase (TIGR01509 family) [Halanaerobium saccharolyticum]
MKTVIFKFEGVLFQKQKNGDFALRCGTRFLLKELKIRQIQSLLIQETRSLDVGFYLTKFNLNNYFKSKNIVWVKNHVSDKIISNFYQNIMELTKLEPENCLVFEDNISGIRAARKAKIGNIVALVSASDKYKYLNLTEVDDVINNFHQFNRLLLRT